MVRSLAHYYFKAAWPFTKKGAMGHRKIGPHVHEKHRWPGQNNEFPELSPKFQQLNPEGLHNYTGVQPTGYKHPKTGEYVEVQEMLPELVVPDLSGFELKPYVSFRTDVVIEEREKAYQKLLLSKQADEEAEDYDEDEKRWPPQPMNAKVLFDKFYADKVREAYYRDQIGGGAEGDGVASQVGKYFQEGKSSVKKMPFLRATTSWLGRGGSKRGVHSSALVLARGPLAHEGWYPRDHQPGPYPKTDEERRAAAIKYGLRPEDYKPISPDSQWYTGDYPDLGHVTFGHKDPWEDTSDYKERRNFGEPAVRHRQWFSRDRRTETGLDEEDFTFWGGIKILSVVLVPMGLFGWYIWWANQNPQSFRIPTLTMPKQYPWDFRRAYPLDHPLSYPVVNYSFEPETGGEAHDERHHHHHKENKKHH